MFHARRKTRKSRREGTWCEPYIYIIGIQYSSVCPFLLACQLRFTQSHTINRRSWRINKHTHKHTNTTIKNKKSKHILCIVQKRVNVVGARKTPLRCGTANDNDKTQTHRDTTRTHARYCLLYMLLAHDTRAKQPAAKCQASQPESSALLRVETLTLKTFA